LLLSLLAARHHHYLWTFAGYLAAADADCILHPAAVAVGAALFTISAGGCRFADLVYTAAVVY